MRRSCTSLPAATRRGGGRLLPAVAVAFALGAAGEARADDAAAAETLFVEGRKLLQEKKYDAACPKLAESQRLDPATGTLLALALCYEGAGKIASAWAAYVEAGSRARTEKNADREAAAKERATALEPRLPRLLLKLAPGVAAPPGMKITRDGAAVGEGSLGTALPVDPGEHDVTIEATGKKPSTQKITVAEGETKQVLVGPFEDTAPAGPSAAPSFFTPLRLAGIAAGAVGVVGLGVGGGLAGVAASKKAESDKDCDGNVCGPVGLPIRKEARSFGDGATIAVIAGGALAAAGITLVLVGGPRAPEGPRTSVAPFVTHESAGVLWQGSF